MNRAVKNWVKINKRIPHARGDEPTILAHALPLKKYSPRTWGILSPAHERWLKMGFIPTCVGNTSTGFDDRHGLGVHPHVRGEYTIRSGRPESSAGSSPRAWGIPPPWLLARGRHRFIPTCVGNTFTQSGPPLWRPVHPHVRGEYYMRVTILENRIGSSPRAWGIHPGRRRPCRLLRFIPTCVGNTMLLAKSSTTRSVHPHVRGEYFVADIIGDIYGGSSPRAWGIQMLIDAVLGVVRFIPTCVGNTPRRRS